ncbi:hypothetical protein T484DRAFT_2586938 [Baffinella frigidus]|nr:hypothetical protein T484DRAFT_2586938 [Cryptophyta sp. CCMP2293]
MVPLTTRLAPLLLLLPLLLPATSAGVSSFVPGVPAGLRLRGGSEQPQQVEKHVQTPIQAVPANPCKIFIGNLPRFANATSLTPFLAPYGQVTLDVKMHPKYADSCKGFALATYDTPEEATAALAALSGSFFLGRSLLVKADIGLDPEKIAEKRARREVAIAKAAERATSSAEGGDAGPVPRRRPTMGARDFWPKPSEPGTRVYVGNIRFGTTWQQVRDHLAAAGRVEFGRIIKRELVGEDGMKRWVSRGFAIAQYASAAEANYAVETLSGAPINGRPVYVKPDTPKKFRPKEEGGGDGGGEGGQGGEGGGEGGHAAEGGA